MTRALRWRSVVPVSTAESIATVRIKGTVIASPKRAIQRQLRSNAGAAAVRSGRASKVNRMPPNNSDCSESVAARRITASNAKSSINQANCLYSPPIIRRTRLSKMPLVERREWIERLETRLSALSRQALEVTA